MNGDLFLNSTILSLSISLLFGLIALFLAVVVIKLIDLFLYRKLDFEEEIKNGNIAAAIFVAALLLFIAIILGNALR